ncbi:hypothetical protein JOQ06_027864, partial [Pogonophryne albipinna]
RHRSKEEAEQSGVCLPGALFSLAFTPTVGSHRCQTWLTSYCREQTRTSDCPD